MAVRGRLPSFLGLLLVAVVPLISSRLPTCNGVLLPMARLVNPQRSPWKSSVKRGGQLSEISDGNSTALPDDQNQPPRTANNSCGANKPRLAKFKQYVKKVGGSMAIGVRTVAYDHFVQIPVLSGTVPYFTIKHILNRAMKTSPRFGKPLQQSLSKILRCANKAYWAAHPWISWIALAAWGVKLSRRYLARRAEDPGEDHPEVPPLTQSWMTCVGFTYSKLMKCRNVFMARFGAKMALAYATVLAPIEEEFDDRFLLSSIGFSRSKSPTLCLFVTSFLFGIGHIGQYAPNVDVEQAIAKVEQLIMEADLPEEWGEEEYTELARKLLIQNFNDQQEMSPDAICVAVFHCTQAFLRSRYIYGPIFVEHGVAASIAAHAASNTLRLTREKVHFEYQCLMYLLCLARSGNIPKFRNSSVLCVLHFLAEWLL